MTATPTPKPPSPPGKSRVWILAIAILAVGCGGRSEAIDEGDLATSLAVGMALAPHQDVLVWTTDTDGRETSVWIRGNAHEAAAVASGPVLAIPVGEELWQWQETEVAVPLCDCEIWEQGGMEGACPAMLEPGWGRSVRLVELVSGESIELVVAPADEETGPQHIDFSATAEPIGSVGPYLFFRVEEGGTTCGAAHGFWSSEFKIVDLASREIVDVLSPDERARIQNEEQQTAYQLMRDDRLVDITGAEDLELTAIEPRWTPGGLALLYQFTAEASYADADDNWGAYTRSVHVPARELPAALLPFALLPEVLGSTMLPPGGEVRVGGFNPIVGTDAQIAAILGALDATPGPTPDQPPDSQ